MRDTAIEVSIDELAVDVSLIESAIEVQHAGPRGPAGIDGDVELYDSTSAPLTPPFPYLRFARDIDGDVQSIVLGTVD